MSVIRIPSALLLLLVFVSLACLPFDAAAAKAKSKAKAEEGPHRVTFGAYVLSIHDVNPADDSYGVIGGLRADAWRTYLAIDWRATGLNPTDYWRDPCEVQLWEP